MGSRKRSLSYFACGANRCAATLSCSACAVLDFVFAVIGACDSNKREEHSQVSPHPQSLCLFIFLFWRFPNVKRLQNCVPSKKQHVTFQNTIATTALIIRLHLVVHRNSTKIDIHILCLVKPATHTASNFFQPATHTYFIFVSKSSLCALLDFLPISYLCICGARAGNCRCITKCERKV
jgi:hypothetical protein